MMFEYPDTAAEYSSDGSIRIDSAALHDFIVSTVDSIAETMDASGPFNIYVTMTEDGDITTKYAACT